MEQVEQKNAWNIRRVWHNHSLNQDELLANATCKNSLADQKAPVPGLHCRTSSETSLPPYQTNRSTFSARQLIALLDVHALPRSAAQVLPYQSPKESGCSMSTRTFLGAAEEAPLNS